MKNYSEHELYRFNIMQLREIGKGMYIKGVTNKDKRELVVDILKNQTQNLSVVGLSSQDARQINEDLKSILFADNVQKNSVSGFCLIENGEYLSRVSDELGMLTNIVLPQFVVEKNRLNDGDFIVFKCATSKGINYVDVVISINDNLQIDNSCVPTRKIEISQGVHERMIELALQVKNSVIIAPLCSYDQINIFDKNDIKHISWDISIADEEQDLYLRLALPRILRKSMQGKHMTAIVDVDKLYLGFLMRNQNNVAMVNLAKFFCQAKVFVNGGRLDIIFVTQNVKLERLLQSYNTV